jgi:hypothetical protein
LYGAHYSLELNGINYSDKLYFDLFSHKWKTLPQSKDYNHAFLWNYLRIKVISYSPWKWGIGFNFEGKAKISRGFIETWFYANEDWNTLLKKSDINYYLSSSNVYGYLNYYTYYNLFFKRKINRNLAIILNILKGEKLFYLKLVGSNTKERFLADLKYIYTGKNILTPSFYKSNNYNGYGISIDLDFHKKIKQYYFNILLHNLLGFIKWNKISKMIYHFDSNTKYIGTDGYYHFKPFGVGYYSYSDFYQRLPFLYRYNFNYCFRNFPLIVGLEGAGTMETFFSEIYSKYHFSFLFPFNLKIGYVYQRNTYIAGLSTKHLAIEFSDNLEKHTKFARIYFKIQF